MLAGGERGIPVRRRAERINLRSQVAVAPDAFGKVRGADDDVDVGPRGCGPLLSLVGGNPGFKNSASRGINRVRVLSIPFVQLGDVARIDALDLLELHSDRY